jgi:hypothetical protein
MADREKMIGLARAFVADVCEDSPSVIGAYIDGSVAWDDLTPVSDVDVAIIASGRDEPSPVGRRVAEGTVVEWMIIPHAMLNVEDILGDAGWVHDMRRALILLDTDDLLKSMRDEVGRRYTEPDGILRRCRNQIRSAEESIEAMEHQAEQGELIAGQRRHVGAIRSLLGLPRALANRRCTMGRGFPFCREAALELGWPHYAERVADLLGASGSDRESVLQLHELAAGVIRLAALADEERSARLHKLAQAPWLLEHGPPADAVWPLYVWAGLTMDEAARGGTATARMSESWSGLAGRIGVGDLRSLRSKAAQAKDLLAEAVEAVESWGRGVGCWNGASQSGS